MENLNINELIKEVSDIIGNGKSSQDDLKKLTQLRWYLSIKYRDTNMEWSADEWLYNNMRAADTVELQRENPVGKAENIAKANAEAAYWSYRNTNADAQWISKLIGSIEAYVISCQIENKQGNNTQF